MFLKCVQNSGGGTDTKTVIAQTENANPNTYVDVPVKGTTEEWYLLCNLPFIITYDGWHGVEINGTSIGDLSQFESLQYQIGNQSGSYGCWVVHMTRKLNAGDIVRLKEINGIAGVGIILCNQPLDY